MRLRSIYSAISYAVATLALSTAAVAAPAEVSGVNHQPNMSADLKSEQETMQIAFNQHALIPTSTITSTVPGNSNFSDTGYNSARLDELEKRINAELATLIELRSI
jgi:hypothetical protein